MPLPLRLDEDAKSFGVCQSIVQIKPFKLHHNKMYVWVCYVYVLEFQSAMLQMLCVDEKKRKKSTEFNLGIHSKKVLFFGHGQNVSEFVGLGFKGPNGMLVLYISISMDWS